MPKKKKINPLRDDVLSGVPEFEQENLEVFGELMAAGDALIELREEPKEDPRPEDLGRLKVKVVRAYLYVRSDPLSRSIAALSFGNLLRILEPEDYSDKFFKVELPRVGKSLEGFVLKTKVQRI